MSSTDIDHIDQQVPEGAPEDTERESFVDFLKELPILIVVAFGIALLIKTFLVQAFFIPSASMEDTLQIGDRVLVSKLSYRVGDPEAGDIVVFVSPTQSRVPQEDRGPVGNFIRGFKESLGLASSERDFIKRVVAVEGQTVEIKDGKVYVDGKERNEPFVKQTAQMPNYGPTKVGEDEVFVMGDFRSNSHDSRVFGPIKESSIVGRAFILIWPLDRFDWLSRA